MVGGMTTTTSIPIRRESLQRQLQIHRNNLATLEEQAASHGLHVPVDLINEINHARQQIETLEQMLTQNGDSGESMAIDIDLGLDGLLRAMTLIQTRMDLFIKGCEEDRRKLAILWRRDNPTLKHRLSIAVAIVFVAVGASLLFIKESRDLLFGSVFWLGVAVVGVIWACAPLIYLFGRDDPNAY